MELVASKEALGVSYIRFLPKISSLRPIVGMNRKPLQYLVQVSELGCLYLISVFGWFVFEMSCLISSYINIVLYILQFHYLV